MPCWNYGKTSHWSQKCNEEKKTLEKKEETTFVIKGKTHQTFMALTLGHCSNNWYMDICCSQHMSQQKEHFSTYQNISKEKQSIEKIKIVILYTRGNIVFKTWIDDKENKSILKDVNHVPKVGKNLFPTSQGV
jgi:hypothetical protein